jgi:hypothetical protein
MIVVTQEAAVRGGTCTATSATFIALHSVRTEALQEAYQP